MTEKEYRSHPAISRSELWRMHESPEKFKYFKDNPPPPTPSLLFGQVVHKLILEPETFFEEFTIAPEFDKRTKAGKIAYNTFYEQNGDKSVVLLDDYEKAKRMAEKALSVPLVRELLDGEHEKPLFWTDEDTGEECKIRCDCLTKTEDGYLVVDYKTASSAQTEIFNRDIFKFGYHFQAAMYTEGVMKAMNLTERPGFAFIVQEKTPPYAVNIVIVPSEVMTAGIDKFREYLGLYHECKMTGYWFGYTGMLDEPNEAFLPGWLNLGDEDED